MSKLIFFLILSFILIFSQGCTAVSKLPKLLTLKRLGDSQKHMERYIQTKKQHLAKLIQDIEAGRLNSGLTHQEFIAAYGEPVLYLESEPADRGKTLLYRHPTQYFDTDRVYVYFDQDLILDSWDYQPAEAP